MRLSSAKGLRALVNVYSTALSSSSLGKARYRHLVVQKVARLSSTSNGSERGVAVIGGGITGLTTAFYAAQDESTQVTVYEKSSALGGWLQSEVIEVEGGEVLFEYGPRALRASFPASCSLLELLFDLNLKDQILRTSVHSAAARNRYIYYPDHLVRLPAPQPGASFLANAVTILTSVFTEPALRGLPWAIVTEGIKAPRQRQNDDESVGEFITRRASGDIADNLVSAIFHGVYAGDIYKLSAEALLSPFWHYERSHRRVIGEIAYRMRKRLANIPYAPATALEYTVEHRGKKAVDSYLQFAKGSSVFTLQKGMGQIARALESWLSSASNVTIVRDAEIVAVSKKRRESSNLTVELADGTSTTFDYVVSTTPSSELAKQLQGSNRENKSDPPAASNLLRSNNYAVTVMVVNLYYRNPDLLPFSGFGYLVPRSVPLQQNSEQALGVIFASSSSVGQDSAQGTKLTVMLGGHWWDTWAEEDFPDEQSAIDMAKSVLQRHLQITEEPIIAKARLQRNAIPQYTVGHVSRMEKIHDVLERDYKARLKVAGAWYTGIGVNDCVRSGRMTAASVISDFSKETGLEQYLHGNRSGRLASGLRSNFV